MQRRLEQIIIRTIEEKDNVPVAQLIRRTLKEFGANHPGTVYYDQTTDHLFEVLRATGRAEAGTLKSAYKRDRCFKDGGKDLASCEGFAMLGQTAGNRRADYACR